jgi:hypothetical protein
MAEKLRYGKYTITFDTGNDIQVYSEYTKRYLTKYYRLGYHAFKLNGKNKFVHHIITEYYLGERAENLCVNHKDGNKLNNEISNLEYVTWSENIKHSYSTGLHTIAKDTKNSPKYIDGRCKDIKKYKSDWYKANREKCLERAKINYFKNK